MPTSLIDELQLDAANSAVPVSDLLRKALVVASKLDVADIPIWINSELSGYKADEELPPHRILYGRMMIQTYQGWIPAHFPTNGSEETFTRRPIGNPVSEIEALIMNRDGELRSGFPAEALNLLQRMFQRQADFCLVLDRSSFQGIISEIRNQVLRWAIALDKAGVRGVGLSFTDPEKEKAHSITFNVNSENFSVGVAGGTGNQANVAGGNNARVNNQSTDSSVNSVVYQAEDMAKLADEFSKLRSALLSRARDAEHYAAVGVVASAEIAAKEGKSSKIDQALSVLGSGGKWVFSVARDIGVHLAAAALKPYLGLPPG